MAVLAGLQAYGNHQWDHGLPWVLADTPRPGAGLGRPLAACGENQGWASGFGQHVPGKGSSSGGPLRAQGGPEGTSVGVCARSVVPPGGARDATEC